MYFYNFVEDLSLNFIQISPLILMIAVLTHFFLAMQEETMTMS